MSVSAKTAHERQMQDAGFDFPRLKSKSSPVLQRLQIKMGVPQTVL